MSWGEGGFSPLVIYVGRPLLDKAVNDDVGFSVEVYSVRVSQILLATKF